MAAFRRSSSGRLSSGSSVEDRLRHEYRSELCRYRYLVDEMQARFRGYLRDYFRRLQSHQMLEIRARFKDCESAIDKLRRKQEGGILVPGRRYTLRSLRDIVGIRILVFPRQLAVSVDECLRSKLRGWQIDHIYPEAGGEPLAFKYCRRIRDGVWCEYQIVSSLLGSYWDVEHDVLYKPDPATAGAVRHPSVQYAHNRVLRALVSFERQFERHTTATIPSKTRRPRSRKH